MSSTETKPAFQVALDDLRSDVTSPDELATLNEWQNEIDSARAGRTGSAPVHELVQLADGTIETKDNVQAQLEAGQEPGGAYDNGRRA